MKTTKTLLAILVEELPKRGGWPVGADFAVQDLDRGSVKFGICESKVSPGKLGTPSVWQGNWNFTCAFDFDHNEVAMDWESSIITRDQYEAALAAQQPVANAAADADGWIEWNGGECPVEFRTPVDARYRNGFESFGLPAGESVPSTPNAHQAYWDNDNNPRDIIAYRLHQPQGVTKVEINAPECVLKVAGTLGSRANDDRLAGDLLELSKARATSAWDKLESLGYFYNGAQWCNSVATAEADLNDCIGQPAEDETLVTFDLLAEIQDADISISLNDAFELAEHLIDVGFRKQ